MKMKKIAVIFIMLLSSFTVLFTSGVFAITWNIFTYDKVIADITPAGNKSIAIAVHDQRPYVLSGEKKPDSVGAARNNYGMQFAASTKSKNPLADDMNKSIAASLSKAGLNCTALNVPYNDTNDDVLKKLKAQSGDVLVVLTLNEWSTDTVVNTDLLYDLNLKIYDKTGALRAEKNLKGKDEIKGSMINPYGAATKNTMNAFKQKMEELLNDPGISKEL